MADPVTIQDYASYPRDDTIVVKSIWRTLNAMIVARIGTLPASFAAYAGQLLVVALDGSGLLPAGMVSGGGSIDFAGMTPVGFKAAPVPLTGAVTLNDTAHRGRLLKATSAAELVVTISPDADPAAGISSGFLGTIWNCNAAGGAKVRLVFSGATNGHPASHTRISPGLGATLWLDGSVLRFQGGTES